MNFFEHQELARKRTKLLVVLYLTAVILIVGTISTLISVVLYHAARSDAPHERVPFAWSELWKPETTLPIALIVLGIIAIGTMWKLLLLRNGGAVVAETLGGQRIPTNTSDNAQRRLLNVVEEMALASGVSVPPVYLLPGESGINAFAAGFTPNDAVIGVTKGCMELLSRDELQGVIAHEFSHILNGDMRLNIRLIGILHGLLLIALTGYLLLRITSQSYSRRYSSKKGGDPRALLFIIGGILYVLGYIGVFFGKLIKSAVSRQREFLADASAVQFTRDTTGIAGALTKIGGLVFGSQIENSHAEEASHMFFSNGLSTSLLSLLSTHPPLDERIKRLNPAFEGTFPPLNPAENLADIEAGQGISQLQAGVSAQPTETTATEMTPKSIKDSIGSPSAGHLRHAKHIIASMPDEIRVATREPFSAGAVIFALLLDSSKEVRQRQILMLIDTCEAHVLKQVMRIENEIDALPNNSKLPLADMCIPALKQFSPAQFEAFERCVQALITADKSLSLFEYALAHTVLSNVEWVFKSGSSIPPTCTIEECSAELATVVSALSWLDTRDIKVANDACAIASKTLGSAVQLLPKGAKDMRDLHSALSKLSGLRLESREKLLEACIALILHDDKVTQRESELLRVIAASLNCPLPPFIATD